MDQNSKKRVREVEQDHKDVTKKPLMKEDHHGLSGINIMDFKDDQYYNEYDNVCYKTSESDLTFGVFDFPWLKDGVVYKTEDWKFEDVFLSRLGDTSISGQYLWQTPETLLDFPEEKLEEKLWVPIEDDHDLGDTDQIVDCIWSSLLNQPLQQPN